MELASKKRIYSLDLLRGLVMIIMALDHTRDFFHYDSFLHDPLDATTTTVFLYFTRWITNFCAPVFVFLAGTSIFLQSLRKSKSDLSIFLFKRGIWLLFVEFVLITFSWTFSFSYTVIIFQVIWAIGISMCCMGLIIKLPYKAILILGLLIVCGHNVLDNAFGSIHSLVWDLAHNGNFQFHQIIPGHQLVVIYPFVPWLGLMMLGYCFGKIYQPSQNAAERKRILIYSGFGLMLLFALLRFANVYGDPVPWTVHVSSLQTIFSFLNIHKYPPSLLYICINIGPALLFLAYFENNNTKLTQAISVYGRVPFFYYILHFYMLHTVCMILFLMRGHAFSEPTPLIDGISFNFLIKGEGYSLKVVYLIWASIVLALYPLCKWFSTYKQRKHYWWLSYL